MFKIITATQFRRNARSVIDDVADAQTTYIVTRYGKPKAVLLTYAQYRDSSTPTGIGDAPAAKVGAARAR